MFHTPYLCLVLDMCCIEFYVVYGYKVYRNELCPLVPFFLRFYRFAYINFFKINILKNI